MNKKGFTLIELLAVIVILAIIALIATPIVLNIINETRDSANLRSAELYLDAVEQGILRNEMKNKRVKNDTYTLNNEGELCSVKTPSECITVEIDGEKPSSANIKIENGAITDVEINLNNKVIVKNTNGELVYSDDATICKLVSEEENTIGSKYSCKVDPNKDAYTFFVLSYNDKNGNITKTKEEAVTTNLIMEQNICRDGSLTHEDKEDKCLVGWDELHLNNNTQGPITAMDYLYDATKNWSNVPNIVMNYTDKGNNYGSIKTEENLTKITKKDETPVKVLDNKDGYTNLKARLPYYEDEVLDYDSNNAYLYNYLELKSTNGTNIQANQVIGVKGYWTASTYSNYTNYAWLVYYDGRVVTHGVGKGYDIAGVRPVITIKL